MAIPLAHAYDTIAEKWIGRVPVTWFKNFPHLKHEGPDGERPDVPKVRLADLTVPKLRQYAAEQQIDLGDATRKDDIVAAIAAAETVPSDPAAPPDPADTEVVDPEA